MGYQTVAQSEVEGRQNQRERHHGKQHVADENREVDGSDGALAQEVRIPVRKVVGDVVDQKQRRRRERREHQLHVQRALALPVVSYRIQ